MDADRWMAELFGEHERAAGSRTVPRMPAAAMNSPHELTSWSSTLWCETRFEPFGWADSSEIQLDYVFLFGQGERRAISSLDTVDITFKDGAVVMAQDCIVVYVVAYVMEFFSEIGHSGVVIATEDETAIEEIREYSGEYLGSRERDHFFARAYRGL